MWLFLMNEWSMDDDDVSSITGLFHCIPIRIIMTHWWYGVFIECIYHIHNYLYSFYEQRILDSVFVNPPPLPWLKPKHCLFVLYCFNSKFFLSALGGAERVPWFLYSICRFVMQNLHNNQNCFASLDAFCGVMFDMRSRHYVLGSSHDSCTSFLNL